MKSQKASLLFPIALVFFEIATYLSNDMYLPSLPSLALDFNTTEQAAQDTLLAWFLGSASMQLLMGPLSDRYGRRIVLIVGGVFYIVATLICATTHHFPLMLSARFIQGSTVCSVVVAGYAAIHEHYSTKMAIKIIAIMGSVTILAPAFGPLIGAIIIELSHWRYIFYLLAFWAIVGLALLWVVMPETNPIRFPIQVKEIAQDYLKITKNRAFMGYTLTYCLLFMGMIAWIVESPFVIIERYSRSVLEYGYIQVIVFGGFIAGAQTTRSLIHRLDAIQVVQYGLLIAQGSALILFASCFFTTQLYWFIMLITGVAFGSAMAFGPLHRSAIEACREPMGRRMAISSTYVSLFGVFATLIAGYLKGHLLTHLSLLMALCVIFAFAIFILYKKRGYIVSNPEHNPEI